MSVQMPPVGQLGSGLAGCGWGFEAGLIPAHRPMMSRTRMNPPNPNPPIYRLPGRLRRSLRQALREQVNEAPITSSALSKITISRTDAASPSIFRTLHPSTADWVYAKFAGPLVLDHDGPQRGSHDRVTVRATRCLDPKLPLVG